MFFLADSDNTDWSILIVGTGGWESEYDFVNLGAKIGKKIGKDCDIKLVQKAKDLDIYIRSVKSKGLTAFIYTNGERLVGDYMKKM